MKDTGHDDAAEPWAPIPPHAIEIAGSWVLPERITEIEGRPYVRCELHGLIAVDHRCEDSPGDHYCIVAAHPNHTVGDDHDDQATPHGEWAAHLLDRLQAIVDMHQVPPSESGGMTSGCCGECSYEWPCPTVHLARGWGEIHDCWDEGWCRHAGVKLSDPTPDLIDVLQDEADFEGDDDA